MIPERLPLSGKKGSEKLIILERRAEFLKKRISDLGNASHRSYDNAEMVALEWIIRNFILYENLLKKGDESKEF